MSQATEKDLARAKRIRERKLARLAEMVAACNCMWPITAYRNRHGHSETCPAVAAWQKDHEERQEAQDAADDH